MGAPVRCVYGGGGVCSYTWVVSLCSICVLCCCTYAVCGAAGYVCGAVTTNQRGHLQVPVEVAERGLREAGCVNIPQDIWDAIATPLALSVVCDVEVPRKQLRPEELAMIRARVRQNHLAVLRPGMRGFGRAPNAPILLSPKLNLSAHLLSIVPWAIRLTRDLCREWFYQTCTHYGTNFRRGRPCHEVGVRIGK